MTEIKKNTLLKRMWKGRTGYLFLLPLMIGVICFAYYPPILAIIKVLYRLELGKLGLRNRFR